MAPAVATYEPRDPSKTVFYQLIAEHLETFLASLDDDSDAKGLPANGDLVYRYTRPWSDGTSGIKMSPLELMEKLAALVPLPRAHLVRYSGCLAPHSKLRAAIIPTPCQQGADDEETKTTTPYWNWARLLGRVFDPEMATCLPPLCGRREPCDLSFCRRSALRIIAAITHEEVITRILRHLKLASVPPPIAPARCCQEIFAFD
jgi:hypothetical protein